MHPKWRELFEENDKLREENAKANDHRLRLLRENASLLEAIQKAINVNYTPDIHLSRRAALMVAYLSKALRETDHG